MQYVCELVNSQDDLPVKGFIHSVNGLEMHWHNEMEFIFVLQGTVHVRVGKERYILNENDIILINSKEIHNISKTKEDNILLALQVNPEYYSAYYPDFSKMIFDCKSFLYAKEEQERFNIIRHHLAKIVWELNKKGKGHQLIIGSELHLLAAYLVNNFEYSFIEDEKVVHRDIERLQSILNYINKNFVRKVTLREIADEQQLSIYYLSHFIKNKLGMSFQEYLNCIRLDKAINLLLNSNKTITEISHASGFASTKYFNKLFKDTYACSPTEYKKNAHVIYSMKNYEHKYVGKKEIRTYLDIDRKAALKKLFSHLKFLDNGTQEDHMPTGTKEIISVNEKDEGVCYQPYWKKLITYTRASKGLRENWQNQLQELQSEIGFEYIKFHGIFSDDMMVCSLNETGGVTYNWSYINELFDFFKKVQIKPFIELGFMPLEIKKSNEKIFWRGTNISQPIDIELWTDLVVAFVKHCINRYGLKEVETWYFEVWNEPDLEHVFGMGGKEKYCEFYEQTALAVKSVSNRLKVGGPAITHQPLSDGTRLEEFLIYCNQNSVPLDFISLHIYPESYTANKDPQDLVLMTKQGEVSDVLKDIRKIYLDKNYIYDTLNSVHDIMSKCLPYNPEIHVTKWNASAYSRNLIHDTCFVATFIISNILKCIGKTDSMGYWTFTDINEELKAGVSTFYGGFGLINNHGLKKPSYWSYYLLSKLGQEIIAQDDEHIITKEDEDIQILIFNYAYFNDLFLNGDTSSLTNRERYLVYEAKPVKEIELNISGLVGNYKITKYCLNREHGSVFDEWVKMGAPENMLQEELNYLKGKAYPKVTKEYLTLNGDYQEKLYVPAHGVKLIILEKIL